MATNQTPSQNHALVTQIQGVVWLIDTNGVRRPLRVGDEVAEGQHVVTERESRLEITLPSGSPLAVASARELLIDESLLGISPADKTEAALKDLNSGSTEVNRIFSFGGDLSADLDPPSSGMEGTDNSESHSFVRVLRIQESLTPLEIGRASGGRDSDQPIEEGGNVEDLNRLVAKGDKASGTGTINDDDSAPTVQSVTSATQVEGTSLVHTVTLTNASSSSSSFAYTLGAGSATSGTDYTNPPTFSNGVTLVAGNLIVPAGVTSFTITVPTTLDTIDEGASENYNLSVGGVAATGTITDDDNAPSLSINDVFVNEAAGTATFTVTLSAASGQTVTVGYNTNNETATSGADYSITTGTLIFAPGETTKTITVTVANDLIFEGPETFKVNLTTPVNATIFDNQGVATIQDDEPAPTLNVSNPTVTENAGYAQFTVSLSNPSTVATTVSLALNNGTASGSGTDFGSSSATNLQVSSDGGLTWTNATSYTFAAGRTNVLVRTPITDDNVYEPGASETFTLTATRTAGYTTNVSASGTASITDNDSQPTLSVSDAYVIEGGNMVFTVSLSNPSTQTVTVNYATTNNTATAGATNDYVPALGILTFAPGETTKTVTVSTRADGINESNETLFLNLATPINATLFDSQGIGTIMEKIQAVPDSATVYEAALPTGTAPSSPLEVTSGNLLTNDFSPGTMTINRVTFAGVNYTASGGVITVDTPLGLLQVYTTTGTYSGVARNAGDYVYTLQTNSTGGDNVSENFSYRITDGTTTSTSTLSVKIVDDTPIGNDIRQSLTAAPTTLTYNLTFVLDVSGSMSEVVSGTKTRLQVAQEALANMLREYEKLGDVNVKVITFSETTAASPWYQGNVNSAINFINAQSPQAGTNYDDGLNRVISEYAAQPAPTADKRLIYFISDGNPNAGHSLDSDVAYGGLTGVAAWEKFVTDKVDISFAIGIGSGVSLSNLTPVAYPNTNGDQYALVVTNETQLSNTLLATVDSGVAQGAMALAVASGSVDGLILGADGGNVSKLVVDGVTYLYDPTATSQPNNSTLVSGLVERTFTTQLGATLTFNFATGAYKYQVSPDANIMGQREGFDVTVRDLDGDEKTAKLIIDLNYEAPVDANRDQLITNIVDGSPITVSAEALLFNDAKIGNTVITNVSGAVVGSVSGTSTITFVPTTAVGIGSPATSVTESATANDSLATAIDLTNRALFGVISTTDAPNVGNPALPGLQFSGSISAANDTDYIKVSLRAGETIIADIDTDGLGSTLDSIVKVLDSNGNALQTADDSVTTLGGAGSTSNTDSYMTFTASTDGVYYLQVASYGSGSSGAYKMWLQIDSPQNQPGFDYTMSNGTISDTTHVDISRIAGSTLTGTAGDDVMVGGNTNDDLSGGAGRDALLGGAGADTLRGEAGNDLLDGGTGNDVLLGGDGIDRLIGGTGNDTLTGGTGADVFAWKLGDAGTAGTPAVDTITDFDLTSNSDKLDLRDLLQGESANLNLQNYLDITTSGSDTIVRISSTGGFTNGNYVAGAEDQRIVLQGVADLGAALGLGPGASETQIISDLINKGKLITD